MPKDEEQKTKIKLDTGTKEKEKVYLVNSVKLCINKVVFLTTKICE